MRIFNLQLEDSILKKLLLFTIALVMMLFSQVHAANVDTVKAAIVKHSIEMGVDPAITLSIAKTESGYRHETKSPYGAVGVFQLMPSTARRMGLNPYDLNDNVKGGVMYYKSMYKMFGSMELAVAAYNAGPTVVKRYKAVPPIRETKKFVSRIMSDYYYLKAHTDPAVTAYMKAKKAQEQKLALQQKLKKEQEQKLALQKQVKEEQNKNTIDANSVNDSSKKATVPTVLANNAVTSPQKAPVPVLADASSMAPVPVAKDDKCINASNLQHKMNNEEI